MLMSFCPYTFCHHQLAGVLSNGAMLLSICAFKFKVRILRFLGLRVKDILFAVGSISSHIYSSVFFYHVQFVDFKTMSCLWNVFYVVGDTNDWLKN